MAERKHSRLHRRSAATSAAVAIVICLAATTVLRGQDPSPPDSQAVGFVQTYCIDCHGEDAAEGDRRFDSLTLPTTDADDLIAWQEVADQLTLGAMPPDDAAQPTPAERLRVIDTLQRGIRDGYAVRGSTGGRTVLRRLNRREYLNTVSDLFDMNMAMFDPTGSFPTDNTVANFDNIGDALVTSGYLLEHYLEAADRIVEKAFARTEPATQHQWVFRDGFKQQPELNPAHEEAFDFRYLCLYDGPRADRPEGAYGPLTEFDSGVPVDGVYRIKVLAQAMNRDTPYDEKHLKINLDEPFRMGIVPGDTSLEEQHTVQPLQPVLAETVIADGAPQWYTLEIPLDQGFGPRFTFPNGMMATRQTFNRLAREYPELLPEEKRGNRGIFINRKNIIRHGYLPHIRIHEVHVIGPIGEAGPTRTRKAILGDEPFTADRTEALLRTFATRAYRRPVTPDELKRLMRLVADRTEAGRTDEQAFRDALKAVLCSPAFLYLQPGDDPSADRLSAYALASRLSYFLWSTMPDDRLFELAASDRIGDPDVLRREVRRMSADPRSEAFLEGFLDGWLNLRDLGSQPPDRDAFAPYYADDLEASMRTETKLFLRHLIDEDRSLVECLSADYSFINRDLAMLYGVGDAVPGEDAQRFRRIHFDDPRRGGLLGQASVLTATANGIETSPVTRGVWMLEKILGSQAPPPPDDVPAIDPDVRGATSIRDLLEKHRSDEACSQCHRKIDPLGFALESFDPIGRLRDRYPNKAKVDPSGRLPGGETFADLGELKSLLVERKSSFARGVTERLFVYALGRQVEASDRPEIDEISRSLQSQDYPLRSLIEAVVLSDLFASR